MTAVTSLAASYGLKLLFIVFMKFYSLLFCSYKTNCSFRLFIFDFASFIF